MAKITINRNFTDRAELDSYIRTRFGTDPWRNEMHSIELSASEMSALSLSENTTVFGVMVVKAEEVDTGMAGTGIGFEKAK